MYPDTRGIAGFFTDPGLERSLAAAALACAVALVLAFSRSDALRRPVAILAASAFLASACLSPGPSVARGAGAGPAEEPFSGEEGGEAVTPGELQCSADDFKGQKVCVSERAENEASRKADQRCRFLTMAIGKQGSYTESGYAFLDNGRIRSYMNSDYTDVSTEQDLENKCYIIPTDAILNDSNNGCSKGNLGINDEVVVEVEMDADTNMCNIEFRQDVIWENEDVKAYAKSLLTTLNEKAEAPATNLEVSIT
jgi:hypothetical protein